ncbi:hypothetical protein [Bacteroides neonati]|uniref:hypothetical protein n=1 Tax=Bacteroides neonati TaxID=1347393 RepID=UPI0004AD9F6C|nr:hypothetical protein [Bacteroides neonati]
MKKFTELVIESEEVYLIQLLDKLKKNDSKQFVFEKKLSEEYAQNIFAQENQVACFKTTSKKHFDSKIWIVANNAKFKVTNIVSNTISDLGIDRYNKVMNDFYYDFLKNYLDQRYNVHYSGEMISMDSLISPKAYEALSRWEATCNKSNPIGYAYDEALWFEFLKQIVENNDELNASDFEKWLIEDKGWNQSYINHEVNDLTLYYEYSIALLKYYENSK